MSIARIQGLKEVQAALKALPREMQRQAEAAVLRGGGKVIADSARTFVPEREGDLKKSIAFNVRFWRGEYSARIGPRAGSRRTVGTYSRGKKSGQPKYKNPRNYSHLIEFGTAHHAAQPFLQPAMDSSKGQVVNSMLNSYRKHLDKIAKRVAKRRARA